MSIPTHDSGIREDHLRGVFRDFVKQHNHFVVTSASKLASDRQLRDRHPLTPAEFLIEKGASR
jgi:hypothetical protein